MKIIYYAITDCGKIRKENQDSYLLPEHGVIEESSGMNICATPASFAVFDGMGGEQAGGKAADIARETSLEVIRKSPECSFKKLVMMMNSLICQYMQEMDIGSMGTTAAFLRVTDEQAKICNVGDSRIYKISDGKIIQLSFDHAINVGQRRVLTQHLGIPVQEMLLEPYENCCSFSAGDIFLLCSDGLTDMVSSDRILSLIEENDFQKCGQLLVDEALENSGKDNITIILCKIL